VKTATLTATLLFLSILTAHAASSDGFTFEWFLMNHDADGDDIVTQSEFSGPQQMFTRMDSNKDNSVTRAEFETAMRYRRSNRSSGGNRFEQGRQRYAEQNKLLHERYQDAGLTSELHILEGAGHGGVVFSDEERFQRIKAFLERNL